jgi:hypothetical protein
MAYDPERETHWKREEFMSTIMGQAPIKHKHGMRLKDIHEFEDAEEEEEKEENRGGGG